LLLIFFFSNNFCLPLFWGEALRLNKFWLCAACAIYLRAMTVRVSALGWVGSAAILHNANYNDNRKQTARSAPLKKNCCFIIAIM
jgi:hypothetical protein